MRASSSDARLRNAPEGILVLDTYALVEIRNGNPKFAEVILSNFLIPDLTMAEFYLLLWKSFGEEEADLWHRKLSHYCSATNRQTMIEAMKFRHLNRKDNVSVFDAVGYMHARNSGFTFVTGDRAFRGKQGVRFIQA